MQEVKAEEVDFSQLQEQLVKAVVEGDLQAVAAVFGVKGFAETGQICTQTLSKIFNLPVELLNENHFLIMQMVISIHPNLNSTIVNTVCGWLIMTKTNSNLSYGQRILQVFTAMEYIGECQLKNLTSITEIEFANKDSASPESLSCEMSLAIYTNNVEEFEDSFASIAVDYDVYREILIKCFDAQAYDIITLLLQQFPVSAMFSDKVIDCISLLKEHLYSNAAVNRNGAKISLLQYIAMSFALAEKTGKLRRTLTQFVDQLVQDAKIAVAKDANLQERINLLILAIDPEYESHLDMRVEAPRQAPTHRLFDQAKLAVTYLYNVVQTREGGQFNRRDFIDDSIMLGMMPGCKCGWSIVSEFKEEKNKKLGLVVTCLEDWEIRWEGLLYTPASPEYWRNMPGNIKQVQVPLKDFGFETEPVKVFTAINKMYEVVQQGLGIYIHCAKGKGRSVFVLALYYVLFSKELQGPTLMDTIRNVYNFIATSRAQICNVEKSWDAVFEFVPLYLQSNLRHPDVCLNLQAPQQQASVSVVDSDTDSDDALHCDHYNC